MEEMMCRTDGF